MEAREGCGEEEKNRKALLSLVFHRCQHSAPGSRSPLLIIIKRRYLKNSELAGTIRMSRGEGLGEAPHPYWAPLPWGGEKAHKHEGKK